MAKPRGSDIETIRKARGLKRSVVAERVGISYKHLYGIEKGHNTAAQETLQVLADVLGVQITRVMADVA